MESYRLFALTFLLILLATLLYFTRRYWLPSELPNVFPFTYIRYEPIRGSFNDDAAAGMHSSTFDLSTNIEAGDSRGGLDERGKKEVQRIMKSKGLNFDEARKQVVMDRFKKENIGPDGRPRDPKFVSFS